MADKNSKRSWQNAETRAFLLAYLSRQSEFENSKKKKYAMSNVLEDLISQNVLTQPTTVELLQTKLKNLLRAYKNSKDSNKRTGRSLSVPPFEDLMDEIFGNNPIISNSHTLSLSGEEIAALTPSKFISTNLNMSESENLVEVTHTSISTVNPTSTSESSSSYGVVQKPPTTVEVTDTPVSPTSTAGSSSSYGVIQKPPAKRSTLKEKYFAEKIKVRERYYANKINEMRERRLDKQQQHKEKMEALINLKN